MAAVASGETRPRTLQEAQGDARGALLSVSNLSIDFVSVEGRVRILYDVSMHASEGEIVGIVGESGSGKTTLGLAILGLLDSPPTDIVSGSVVFEGKDLLRLGSDEMAKIRGTGINMVFQEPLDSLNPVYRVESQIAESIEVQGRRRFSNSANAADRDSKKIMTDLLRDLCIDKPDEVLEQYPHELSGGMRQRVAISMSIIERPKLLIVDEPTTGLDAYVQNRILGMLSDLRKAGGTLLYVTHDLTVASQVCDRLYIMYAGRIMESGETQSVLEDSLHPYTRTLIASVPQGYEDSPPLPIQLGEPPNPRKLPDGCKFHPRCPYVKDVCMKEAPRLVEVVPGRYAACWKVAGEDGKYSRD